jgi:uncharacterized membrane protein YphA (DoxX/SURF4 family)
VISQKRYRTIPDYRVRRAPQTAHAPCVQRLFSMFPAGLPGLALLLLRASVATALLVDNYSHRGELSGWIQAAAMLISVASSVGYLTPVVAVMSLVFHALIWSGLGIGSVAFAAMISLDAIALALLGPGAYSVDSYRFGRRVVVLPPP